MIVSDTAQANHEYRFKDCDHCDREDVPCPYEVCLPRPSNPSEMCCVLCFCTDCVTTDKVPIPLTEPSIDGGLALYSDWRNWCERQGLSLG